jgi:hypothetical protein
MTMLVFIPLACFVGEIVLRRLRRGYYLHKARINGLSGLGSGFLGSHVNHVSVAGWPSRLWMLCGYTGPSLASPKPHDREEEVVSNPMFEAGAGAGVAAVPAASAGDEPAVGQDSPSDGLSNAQPTSSAFDSSSVELTLVPQIVMPQRLPPFDQAEAKAARGLTLGSGVDAAADAAAAAGASPPGQSQPTDIATQVSR